MSMLDIDRSEVLVTDPYLMSWAATCFNIFPCSWKSK